MAKADAKQSEEELKAAQEQAESKKEAGFEGESEKTEVMSEIGKIETYKSLNGENRDSVVINKSETNKTTARVSANGDIKLKTVDKDEDKIIQKRIQNSQILQGMIKTTLDTVAHLEGLSDDDSIQRQAELAPLLYQKMNSALDAENPAQAFVEIVQAEIRSPSLSKKDLATLLSDPQPSIPVQQEILRQELALLGDAPDSVKDILIDKADGYTTLRADAVNLALDKGSEWVSERLTELASIQKGLDTSRAEGRQEQAKMQSEFIELENMLPIVERIEKIQAAPYEAAKLAEQAKKDFNLDKSARIDWVRTQQASTIDRIVELQQNLQEAKNGLRKIQEQIDKGTNVQESLDSQSEFVKDIRSDIKMYMQELDMLDSSEEALKASGFDLAQMKEQVPTDTDLFHVLTELPNHQTMQAVETMLSRSDIPDKTKDILRAYQNAESTRAENEHTAVAKAAEGEGPVEGFEKTIDLNEASQADVTSLIENIASQPFLEKTIAATPKAKKLAEHTSQEKSKENYTQEASTAFNNYTSFMADKHGMKPDGIWMKGRAKTAEQIAKGDFFTVSEGENKSPYDFIKGALGKYERNKISFADQPRAVADYTAQAELARAAMKAMEQSPDFANYKTPNETAEVAMPLDEAMEKFPLDDGLEDLPADAIIKEGEADAFGNTEADYEDGTNPFAKKESFPSPKKEYVGDNVFQDVEAENSPDSGKESVEIGGLTLELSHMGNGYQLKTLGNRVTLGKTKGEADKYFAYAKQQAETIQGATLREKADNLAEAILDFQDAEYAKEDLTFGANKQGTQERPAQAPELSFGLPEKLTSKSEQAVPAPDLSFNFDQKPEPPAAKKENVVYTPENVVRAEAPTEALDPEIENVMKTIELPNITKIESLSTETGISAEDIVEFNVLYNLIPESAKLQEGLPGKFDSVLDTKAQKPATSAIGKWIQQRISFGDSPRKQLFDKAALVIAQFDWGGPELSEESKKVVAAFSGAARDKMAKAATDKAKSLNLGKL